MLRQLESTNPSIKEEDGKKYNFKGLIFSKTKQPPIETPKETEEEKHIKGKVKPFSRLSKDQFIAIINTNRGTMDGTLVEKSRDELYKIAKEYNK